MTYLDYAAKAPEINLTIDAGIPTHGSLLNPNQPYAHEEKRVLKEAEQMVLKALKSYTGHVVFGANATMLFEWLGNVLPAGVDPFAMSAYEHDCVDKLSKYLSINSSSRKLKNIEELEDWAKSVENEAREESAICFWMWVQNLTGEEFPIDKIGRICHEHGVTLVSDFTAGLHNSEIPKGIDNWCDIAVFSGEKIGAPAGTGAMWVSDRIWRDWEVIDGLPHFGTPNVVSAWRIAKGVERCQKIVKESDDLFFDLYAHLTLKLTNPMYKDLTLCRPIKEATEGIVLLHLTGINADAFQQYASTKGVYFSVFHSACAGSGDYRIAEAYGVDKQTASECVRLSFGYDTTTEDIDEFIKVLKEFREMFCSNGVCETKKELAGRGISIGLSK